MGRSSKQTTGRSATMTASSTNFGGKAPEEVTDLSTDELRSRRDGNGSERSHPKTWTSDRQLMK
jgi:hypothetical protein